MRVLVLGAGGIGGYFGGRLVQAGVDVTFLVRERRAALLRANGLVIESRLGNARIDVKTTTAPASGYDLVLLSCKAYDLGPAIAAVRPAVTSGTGVLPLLNGLAHMDALDHAFGRAAVLGGLAHISATLAPDGRILHLNKLHSLTFGPRAKSQESRCDEIASLFSPALFEVRRSPTILQDVWEKFVFITAASAITCLMRAPIGAVLAAPGGERLIRETIAECEGVAAAAGFPIRPKAQDWTRQALLDTGSPLTASMLRDIEAGAEVEADHLQGDMIGRGDALGVGVALLRVAFCHLHAYLNRRAAG